MPTLWRCLAARPLALAMLTIVAIAAVSSARAEIRVTGVAEAVRLEADDATVDEALTALGALGLRYRSAVALDRRISGTYEGPLARVISRLLQGYNFVVQTSSGSIQATVLENSSAAAVRAPQIYAPGRVPPPVQQEDPTIIGLRRAAQNPAGIRRNDATQPPQVKPPGPRN
jgi:hypothetical protein